VRSLSLAIALYLLCFDVFDLGRCREEPTLDMTDEKMVEAKKDLEIRLDSMAPSLLHGPEVSLCSLSLFPLYDTVLRCLSVPSL